MSRSAEGFTSVEIVEILVELSLSAAVFLIANSLVLNVFSSDLKSKQEEVFA